MKKSSQRSQRTAFRLLDWDSQHYGFSVARIECEPAKLGPLLQRAEEEHVRLIYYLAPALTKLEDSLLTKFAGRHVGGQVVYAAQLAELGTATAPGKHEVEVYSGSEDYPTLLRLGIAAGSQSRFRMDTRLDAERCDALYEVWIRKSARGDMADEVLVARVEGSLAALVTIRCRQGAAEIGLAATDSAYRGRGLASAVMAFAHCRMADLGAERAQVVTQTENTAARALYERFGYQVVSQGEHYHFMPRED